VPGTDHYILLMMMKVAHTVMLFMVYADLLFVSCYVSRFMEPAVIAILGGVLPFGSIFIEMYV